MNRTTVRQSAGVWLGDLAGGLIDCLGDDQIMISGMTLDSRQVGPGDLFIALAGSRCHGLSHAEEALDRGAAAVLYDPDRGGQALSQTLACHFDQPLLAVSGLAAKAGLLADRFFGSPSSQLEVIGITGTNGKTSCSHFLAQALAADQRCGVVGTLGWGFIDALAGSVNTTPDPVQLQAHLADLQQQGANLVAMEVSSHGLAQGRTNGVHFKGAVFTNLSRDHLDYHGTMGAYAEAKLALFRSPGLSYAVVNMDDEYGRRAWAEIPAGVRVLGFSGAGDRRHGEACLYASDPRHSEAGLGFELCYQDQQCRIAAPVYGDFNVENLLAVAATLIVRGCTLAEAVRRLAGVGPVAGRMERFCGSADLPTVVVDYAHTPDALENVLTSLKRHCRGRLWLVFGCGGERDRGKRPVMGRIARKWADEIVITDDNPRSESGDLIARQIEAGCGLAGQAPRLIRDRRRAIETAVMNADPADIVVIAGKGHETIQECAGVRIPFCDRDVVRELLTALAEKKGGRA